MDFGEAILAMKVGKKCAREGWNGKGMFAFWTEGRGVANNKERSFRHFPEERVILAGHFDMRAVDGTYVTGWLASQADMAADDWMIVD